MRLANNHLFIHAVHAVNALREDIRIPALRKSATTNASAGTSHDLNKVVGFRCSFFNLRQKFSNFSHLMAYCHIQRNLALRTKLNR